MDFRSHMKLPIRNINQNNINKNNTNLFLFLQNSFNFNMLYESKKLRLNNGKLIIVIVLSSIIYLLI